MITVYQLDDDLTLLGNARLAPTKGDRQVLVNPPAVPDGHVAKWVTELHHISDTPGYGEEGTGSWEIVEDHRKDTLYLSDGSEYKFDGDYNGLGPIPVWLSPEAPSAPENLAEEKARWKRDELLRGLDAIVSNPLRWGAFTESERQGLADYRQALLDVPQQSGFPEDIDWPVNPLGGDGVD